MEFSFSLWWIYCNWLREWEIVGVGVEVCGWCGIWLGFIVDMLFLLFGERGRELGLFCFFRF